MPRDDILLATKVRMAMGDGPNDAGLSRHHIIRGCEASLRRLNTDYIDLYQVHEWDGQTPLEETLAALEHLVDSGKVRYVGASNYTGWQLMKALGVAERTGGSRFVSQQIYYSLQARDAESELVPVSVDQGLGILVWSPLAGGLLSGKYRRGQDDPAGSRRFEGWDEPPVHDEDKLYDTIDALVEIADGHGVSAAEVALAWTLGRPAVTSLIIGARTDEQLGDEPAGRRAGVDRRRAVPPRSGQRPAAALSALAPGQHLGRSAQRRRPHPARSAPGLTGEPARRLLRLWLPGGGNDNLPARRVRRPPWRAVSSSRTFPPSIASPGCAPAGTPIRSGTCRSVPNGRSS